MHKSVAWTAAGLAAAGVVAVSVGLGAQRGEGPDVNPPRWTPSGYDEWLTEVPAGFDLAHGLPGDGGDLQRVERSVEVELCGTEWLEPGAGTEALRVGATGPEYADLRDLRLFTTDRAAHRYLSRASDVATGCPQEEHGATVWSHAVADPGLGQESLRVVRTYETDGMINAGADWWDVVRVGNAVLVTGYGGEYLPGETLGSGIAARQRTLTPIVDRMCVFSAAGC